MGRYYNDSPQDYVAHHGVLGMKWGKRNGPPYPLNAAGRKKLMRQNGMHYKVGNARVDLDEFGYDSGYGERTTGRVDPSEATYIRSYKYYQSEPDSNGNFRYRNDSASGLFSQANKQLSDGRIDPEDYATKYLAEKETGKSARLDRRISNETLASINPNYGAFGTTQNCAFCSTAVELASRGYPVTAGLSARGAYTDAADYWWNGTEDSISTSDRLEDDILSQGKSSGTLSFRYPGNDCGHAVHYNSFGDGTLEIQDGQCNKRFDKISDVYENYGFDPDAKVGVHRLDKATPNFVAMANDDAIQLDSNDKLDHWYSPGFGSDHDGSYGTKDPHIYDATYKEIYDYTH